MRKESSNSLRLDQKKDAQLATTDNSNQLYMYRFSEYLNLVTTKPRKCYIPVFFCIKVEEIVNNQQIIYLEGSSVEHSYWLLLQI